MALLFRLVNSMLKTTNFDYSSTTSDSSRFSASSGTFSGSGSGSGSGTGSVLATGSSMVGSTTAYVIM